MCNSQDKSSSNTSLGTHSRDQKLVKSYHTPWHHPICGTGAALLGLSRKGKSFPCPAVQAEHNAGIGRDSSSLCRSPAGREITKKALPDSEPCLSPATAWGTMDCPYYMQQKGSQPAPRNGASRDSSTVTSGPGNPIPASFTAQHRAPPCRHHRKKGANPTRALSNITLLRRDSWAHISFPGKSV